MSKLKIGIVEEEKRVPVTLKLPASVHRDLAAYAEVLKHESGQAIEPTLLIAPMLAHFMATDRTFRKLKRRSDQAAKV